MLLMICHVSDTVDVLPVCPQNQQHSVLFLSGAFVFVSFPPQVNSGLVAVLCTQEDIEIQFPQNNLKKKPGFPG